MSLSTWTNKLKIELLSDRRSRNIQIATNVGADVKFMYETIKIKIVPTI